MLDPTRGRPSFDEYFMGIAMAVRARANCTGNRVGAIIVKDHHQLAAGYNGTAAGQENCTDGGCHRCGHPELYRSGEGYDACLCLHAEQNALLMAARFGISVHGADLYTTMRPCFTCSKEMLQAGIETVYYLHPWAHPDPAHQVQYERLQAAFPGGVHHLPTPDPFEAWAVRAKRPAPAA